MQRAWLDGLLTVSVMLYAFIAAIKATGSSFYKSSISKNSVLSGGIIGGTPVFPYPSDGGTTASAGHLRASQPPLRPTP